MRLNWYVAPFFVLLSACAYPQTTFDTSSPLTPEVHAEISPLNTAQRDTPNPDDAPSTPPAVAPAPTIATPEAQALTAPTIAPPVIALPSGYDADLVRVQVLLDRAHFSPGAIDGRPSENVAKAVRAYRAAHDLPDGTEIDELLLRSLSADTAEAIIAYTIAAEDVRGPFAAIPRGFPAMSRLRRLGYARASEALAEKFHMDEDFLRALNPGVDFSKPGQEIYVANAGGDLSVEVAAIQVDKASEFVSALDALGNVVAHYPATVGASSSPTPTGDLTVNAITFDPTYRYDPSRLPSFGRRGHGALTIAPGPNNPVGVVWMALSRATYGIHGAPEPSAIGKTASHGCVRLTNWDARELGQAIRAGTPVTFIEPAPIARKETPAREG